MSPPPWIQCKRHERFYAGLINELVRLRSRAGSCCLQPVFRHNSGGFRCNSVNAPARDV